MNDPTSLLPIFQFSSLLEENHSFRLSRHNQNGGFLKSTMGSNARFAEGPLHIYLKRQKAPLGLVDKNSMSPDNFWKEIFSPALEKSGKLVFRGSENPLIAIWNPLKDCIFRFYRGWKDFSLDIHIAIEGFPVLSPPSTILTIFNQNQKSSPFKPQKSYQYQNLACSCFSCHCVFQ